MSTVSFIINNCVEIRLSKRLIGEIKMRGKKLRPCTTRCYDAAMSTMWFIIKGINYYKWKKTKNSFKCASNIGKCKIRLDMLISNGALLMFSSGSSDLVWSGWERRIILKMADSSGFSWWRHINTPAASNQATMSKDYFKTWWNGSAPHQRHETAPASDRKWVHRHN